MQPVDKSGGDVAAVLILIIGLRVDLAQCCRPDCLVTAVPVGEPWTKGTLPWNLLSSVSQWPRRCSLARWPLHKPSNARGVSIALAVSVPVALWSPVRGAPWQQPIKSAQGRASLDRAATRRQRQSHRAALSWTVRGCAA